MLGDRNVNDQMLQDLYKSDNIARIVFDLFAKRKTRADETTISSLEKEVGASVKNHGALIGVFRKIEAAGYGKFVIGRRGSETRLEWYPQIKIGDVGRIASGKEASSEPIDDEISETKQYTCDETVPETPQLIPHTYRLRPGNEPGSEITLCLPIDFTNTEASRLADFIRTLPF